MTHKKIGILIGHEWSWPPAFLTEVNRRNAGVTAELIKLSGTYLAQPSEYQVIIDRVSYDVPYYRTFLKVAMLAGTTVINNPLWASAYDRFFNASVVTRMGFCHPRMVALPSYLYPDHVADESLRNLQQSVPWEEYIDYLGGFPVVMRPIRDSGTHQTYVAESFEDLRCGYSKTGTEPMLLHEHISWDKYVRCLCIGTEHILPIKYSPYASWSTRYHQCDTTYLSTSERAQIIESAARINRTLGFDVNAIDFAIYDGELYTVDVTNPIPNFDVSALTPYLFDWVVKTMADYTIDLAQDNRRQRHELHMNQQIQVTPSATGIAREDMPTRRTQHRRPQVSRNITRMNIDELEQAVCEEV